MKMIVVMVIVVTVIATVSNSSKTPRPLEAALKLPVLPDQTTPDI